MAIEQCPLANGDCRYYDQPTPKALRGTQEHGCRSDSDHIIPRAMGKGATKLVQNYIQRSPDNRQQLCREEHEQKTRDDQINPPTLPDAQFMMDSLARERKARR